MRHTNQENNLEVTKGFDSWTTIPDGTRAEIERELQGMVGGHEIYIVCTEVGWTEHYGNSFGESDFHLKKELRSFAGVCDRTLLSSADAKILWSRYILTAEDNVATKENEKNRRRCLFEKAKKERTDAEKRAIDEVRENADKESRKIINNI